MIDAVTENIQDDLFGGSTVVSRPARRPVAAPARQKAEQMALLTDVTLTPTVDVLAQELFR